MKKKNIILILVTLLFSIMLIACGGSSLSSGQRITLSSDTPVCSSKDNVDKVINFVNQNNEQGLEEMESSGEACTLPAGTEVNIIKTGIVIEIETSSGSHYFAPKEVIK